jgi:outer membrane protein OmpA-like peptidoglycan-associated protein
VFGYYEKQIKNSGFEIMLSSKGQKSYDVGGRTWSLFVYKNLPGEFKNNIVRTDTLNMQRGYLSARIKGEEGEAFLTLLASQPIDNEIYVQLDIIEIKPLKRKIILANADSIKQVLIAEGHIALYDIYFEQDKYELKKESEPALKEIAEFLKQNQNLNIYLVVHTDISGRLDNNLVVSKNRATTIVNVLIKRYSISPERILAEGVGPLSPVTSNLTQDGREKNMRIELVLR